MPSQHTRPPKPCSPAPPLPRPPLAVFPDLAVLWSPLAAALGAKRLARQASVANTGEKKNNKNNNNNICNNKGREIKEWASISTPFRSPPLSPPGSGLPAS